MKPRDFQEKLLFPSRGNLVMLCAWPRSRNSSTSTDSPASVPRPRFGASSVIPGRRSSLCGAAEKNGVRRLRAGVSDVLRPAAPLCPRSRLWRQACLPRLLPTQGPVPTVWRREERTTRLSRRQPVLHPGARLVGQASSLAQQRTGRQARTLVLRNQQGQLPWYRGCGSSKIRVQFRIKGEARIYDASR